ncbi:MAG: hypothetical protein IKV61_03970 [Clostridia bacterium]|nr:hypothetical protein [Clostridia bacterium]
MDIKNIVNCFEANGIVYPREFITIEKDGCDKVFEDVYKKTLKRIDALVRFGSNNGFNADLKTGIAKLVKIMCTISKEKRVKLHDKFLAESNKIYSEMGNSMKEVNVQFDMVGKVNTYIEKYKLGMEVLLDMDVASDRKTVLHKGIEKCKQMQSILADVMNNSTASALEQAKEIIKELQAWADIVANKMHDDADLIHLDKAIAISKQWKNNREVVKAGMFGKTNKVADIKELEFLEDNLSMIGKSRDATREIGIFMQNLKEYKEQVVGNGPEKIKEEIELKKEESSKLKAKKDDLVVQFQNGEISKMDLYEECMDIDNEMADVKEDIEDLQYKYNNDKEAYRLTKKVLDNLNSINSQVLEYKADPIYFGLLADELDFSKLTRVMRGAGNTEDVDYIFDVQSILDRVKDRRRKIEREMTDAIRKRHEARNAERRQERQARLSAQMNGRENERSETEAMAEDYINQLLGQTKATENTENDSVKKKEDIAEENTRIALGDDEL